MIGFTTIPTGNFANTYKRITDLTTLIFDSKRGDMPLLLSYGVDKYLLKLYN